MDTDTQTVSQDATGGAANLLDTGDLCRMFEEADDASISARKAAERDRDYVDGKQIGTEELAELERRGQPPVIDNRIKTKIDYLVGLEKQQRVKPKAFPRTPRNEADADAATESLRYVAESEDYEAKRSAVWRNMLVEGFGGIRVYAEPSTSAPPQAAIGAQQDFDIRLQRIDSPMTFERTASLRLRDSARPRALQQSPRRAITMMMLVVIIVWTCHSVAR